MFESTATGIWINMGRRIKDWTRYPLGTKGNGLKHSLGRELDGWNAIVPYYYYYYHHHHHHHHHHHRREQKKSDYLILRPGWGIRISSPGLLE
jgi:hypothetical protein